MSFSCNQCKKSCDVVEVRKDKTKTPTAQKRIREQKKRLDLQRETIQKLVGFFDGITIDPTKGVILTTKKKRQLKELLELLGLEKRSFSE